MSITSLERRLRQSVLAASAEEGQALVEYALLLSLVMMVAFVAVQVFGTGVSGLYSHIVSVYP
jgi:Flp pilus assembly pilin Flp